MLSSLYIENVAVIEKTHIDFSEGFNVLTGETGAGKSIIIDSINCVLGQRTLREIIRNGANSAFVSAVFTNIPGHVMKKCEEYGFQIDEDTLILERELNIHGKNNCRINSRPVTVSLLKEIGQEMIDILGQHESYELMSNQRHIDYIDSYGDLTEELLEYKSAYKQMVSCKKEFDSLKKQDTDREQKIDILEYQTLEIEQANIVEGEYDQLNEQKTIALNQEKILTSLDSAYYILSGNEETSGVIASLEDAIIQINQAADFIEDLEEVAHRVNDCSYELQDCAAEINATLDSSDYSEISLNEIEQRLDVLYKIFRKYGESEKEVLEFYEDALKELNRLKNYEISLENAEKRYNASLEKAKQLAAGLSEKRKHAGTAFCEKVKENLTFLNMPGVELVIAIEECELYSKGMDKVEILISANPGQPPKPISKIASGGELSRIMLAIKNVLSANEDTDTLIFDEVDTGISGSAANKVGLKLKEVSKGRQVICVTHLPSIAALAQTHFVIEKNVSGDKTFTDVKLLDEDGRQREIARIIDGDGYTSATLENAREMLRKAKKT